MLITALSCYLLRLTLLGALRSFLRDGTINLSDIMTTIKNAVQNNIEVKLLTRFCEDIAHHCKIAHSIEAYADPIDHTKARICIKGFEDVKFKMMQVDRKPLSGSKVDVLAGVADLPSALLAEYLLKNAHLVSGHSVCQLNASSALLGVVCGYLGASKVVVSFPDKQSARRARHVYKSTRCCVLLRHGHRGLACLFHPPALKIATRILHSRRRHMESGKRDRTTHPKPTHAKYKKRTVNIHTHTTPKNEGQQTREEHVNERLSVDPTDIKDDLFKQAVRFLQLSDSDDDRDRYKEQLNATHTDTHTCNNNNSDDADRHKGKKNILTSHTHTHTHKQTNIWLYEVNFDFC
eukprot:GHVR01167455.1.p1 GENE.GHVR01167455.1~~GHVR01167455.1.p1  ORF type:complete len:349 (+),score=87.26 GHVR01167455.1:490-1536(+)